MKNIRLSILGLGTIGCKLVEYLQANTSTIRTEYGIDIQLSQIYVRNPKKERKIDVSQLQLTDHAKETIDEADILFECIGGNGTEMTRDLLIYAMEQHKSVIISSKKCLAKYGELLQRVAQKNHVALRYDACVGGGIPISIILENMAKCEKIERIYGIGNATSNFVLSEMTKEHISYEDAIALAKQMGISENDPSEDVDGYDVLYKSIILCGFGLGRWLDMESIIPKTVRNLTNRDIEKAEKQGCVIKSLFDIKVNGDSTTFSIGPKLISRDSLLSCINDINNIIIIESSESGERAFYGLGAGAKPTASAMYDDFIYLIRNSGYNVKGRET